MGDRRPPAMFFEKFAGAFDPLSAVLGDGLLASYLLGLWHVRGGDEGQFADPDPVAVAFDVPPAEAIEYFRAKEVVTREEFDDLFDEARASAFTVGQIYRADVLTAFKDELTQALEAGTPQRETIKRFRAILDGAGHKQLGAFHLETVFRTNLQMAYGVGRRRQMEATVDDLPFWQYSAVLDDRTRPRHAALDGLILPTNHPFWEEHYPPWGFNCRCTVTATDEIPDGYDHRNPSGQAEIAYDREGNPAKAEYGTTVVDLAVGRFKGVPPQGGLGEVITERARESRKK